MTKSKYKIRPGTYGRKNPTFSGLPGPVTKDGIEAELDDDRARAFAAKGLDLTPRPPEAKNKPKPKEEPVPEPERLKGGEPEAKQKATGGEG